MLGDGVHAAFDDPLDAVAAVIALQRALADAAATGGIALAVRCGPACRRRAGARRRLLRAGRESRGAHHERRPRRADHRCRRPSPRSSRAAPPGGRRRCATWAKCGCAISRAPSASTRSCIRRCARSSRRCARSRRRRTTCRSQLTSFVGREREVEEVAQLAREEPAGDAAPASVASARRGCRCRSLPALLDDFPDGVWLVELASLADARLVPEAVASVVGVKEEAGRPVIEALARFVKDRRLLLVLDNCEHLLAGVRGAREPAPAGGGAGADPRVEPRTVAYRAARRRFPVPPLPVPDPFQTLHARYGQAIWGGAAVRRARGGGATGFRGDRRQRDDDRRHLPASRRHSARARAGGGARARAVGGTDRDAPHRSLPAADWRRSHRAAAPADAARADRLELRLAGRRGARALPPSRGLCRRIHARSRGSRRLRERGAAGRVCSIS